MKSLRLFYVLFACALAGLVAGCPINGGALHLPIPGPSQSAEVCTGTSTASGTIADAGGSVSFAPVCGINAVLNYPANNAPSGTTASLTAQAPKPGAALSIPAGATYTVDFQVSLSNSVAFNSGFGGSITLPTTLPTSGHTWYVIVCSPVSPTAGCTGTPKTQGPLSVSGQNIGFSGGSNPFTVPAGEVVEAQLYYTTP